MSGHMSGLVMAQDLKLSWITAPADLAPLRDEWQALASRVGADVFALPDWVEIWWRHFGMGQRLACLVARHQGVLVGVLPFCTRWLWIGPLPVRVARMAGFDPNCIAFQLALEDAWARPVLQAAMHHLLGPLKCAVVSFTPVSEVAGYLSVLRTLADPGDIQHAHPNRGPRLGVWDDAAGSHVVFDFTPQFDDYLATLTKKRRGQFRRDVKGLQETFVMTRDDFAPNAAEFDDFVAFHAQQWQATGKGGHFNDWPGSAAFYHDVAAQTAGGAKLVQMDRLSGTGGPLATEFSLMAGHTAHWRLPARRIDPEVDRLSAGKVVFILMFERLIKAGITRIEAGRGDYGYKVDYGGQTIPVHRLIVHRDTGAARLLLKAVLAWAGMLNYLYYRVWFLKLAPRLRQKTGSKPRPLWRSWIRTRL